MIHEIVVEARVTDHTHEIVKSSTVITSCAIYAAIFALWQGLGPLSVFQARDRFEPRERVFNRILQRTKAKPDGNCFVTVDEHKALRVLVFFGDPERHFAPLTSFFF